MKQTSLVAVGIALFVMSSSAFAYTETCRPTTDAEVAGLFDRWNASLKSGDPQKVVANYAKGSVLLATLSNQPRITREQKLDYFSHFLQKHPVGHIDFRVIEIDCNTALDTGLYTFTFGDGSQARARYTYTYKWNGTDWLITSHHSSLMPEAHP